VIHCFVPSPKCCLRQATTSEYDLNVFLNAPGQPGDRASLRPVGFLKGRVTIPDSGASKLDEAVDLGTVELKDRWP
jgi:hypothetical protein